jgi:hypothetical protein
MLFRDADDTRIRRGSCFSSRAASHLGAMTMEANHVEGRQHLTSSVLLSIGRRAVIEMGGKRANCKGPLSRSIATHRGMVPDVSAQADWCATERAQCQAAGAIRLLRSPWQPRPHLGLHVIRNAGVVGRNAPPLPAWTQLGGNVSAAAALSAADAETVAPRVASLCLEEPDWEFRTSGSVGALLGVPGRATRPQTFSSSQAEQSARCSRGRRFANFPSETGNS